MISDRTILLNQGSKQGSRMPAALESGYIELEERTLEDFLQQAYAFSRQIRFVNRENRVEGDWSDLLINNDTVLLALIVNDKREERERRLRQLLLNRYDGDLQLVLGLVALCVSETHKLDNWYIRLQRIHTPAATLASGKLYELIQTCKDEVQEVFVIHRFVQKQVEGMQRPELTDRCRQHAKLFAGLSHVWSLPKDGETPEDAKYEQVSLYRVRLENCFYTLSNSLHQLSDYCRGLLRQSLSSQQQDPSSALLVAFLQLLQSVNAKTRGFTDKYRNFYYRDVLQMGNRPGEPDRTLLLLAGNKGKTAHIDATTVFIADGDSDHSGGRYATTKPASVVPARVAALANSYLHRDPYNVPAFDLGFINNIHGTYAADYRFMQEDWKRPFEAGNYPLGRDKHLFGGHLLGGQHNISHTTDVGFMIASQTLLAGQGLRKFIVSLELEERQEMTRRRHVDFCEEQAVSVFREYVFQAFKRYLFDGIRRPLNELIRIRQEVRQTLYKKGLPKASFERLSKESLDALQTAYKESRDILIDKVFAKGFNLNISVDDGWLAVNQYECHLRHQDGRYFCEFCFELGESMPAVVPWDLALHGPDRADAGFFAPDLGVPALKVLLSQSVEFYLYSLLQDLVFVNMTIDVAVTGVKDLVVHNDLGPIDTTSPFQPFGALPRDGNSLIIGGAEFSFKEVVFLAANLEWHQLPTEIGGFNSYYRDYGLDINNNDFGVTTRVLRNGNWYSQDNANRQALFGLTRSQKLSRCSRVIVNDPLYFQATAQGAPLRYHSNRDAGFFKLQLDSRSVAFGHERYPHIMNNRLIQSIKSKLPAEMLNEPYTPVLSRISVDYRATTHVTVENLGRGGQGKVPHQVFTVHPFGIQPLAQRPEGEGNYLLPRFRNCHEFYVGLTVEADISGEAVVLYVDLDESTVSRIRRGAPILEWYWMSAGNVWQRIPDKDILSDTTQGFLKTGTVTLQLPVNMNPAEQSGRQAGSTPLNGADRLWLRVRTPVEEVDFCSLKGMEINAVEVVRVENGCSGGVAIAPASIGKSLRTIPGIKALYQPRASRGGREPEKDGAWLQRVSERLRHRRRLVLPWDYERAILEQFGSVEQVKCFPAQSVQDGELQAAPGRLRIVVVSGYSRGDGDKLTRPPPLVSATELEAIKQFVVDRSAGGIAIDVANPDYESIQVRCSVILISSDVEKNPHHALNQALIEYISSWGNYGPDRQFDWEFYEHEIAAFIRELDYVEFVTNLSLLKVTRTGRDSYERVDSVLENAGKSTRQPIRPKHPWSIAIPSANHAIEVLDMRKDIDAEVTGYGELEIGNNFILSE